MINKVQIHPSVVDRTRREEMARLFGMLPADIVNADGTYPVVTAEQVGENHNYSLTVSRGYQVLAHDGRCALLHMKVLVGRDTTNSWVHGNDYIEFADAQHPQKVSHRFWINPTRSQATPDLITGIIRSFLQHS